MARCHLVFVGILIFYVGLCLRLAMLCPLYGPVQDEPLHFGYAKYLAVTGHLPDIRTSEYSLDPRYFYVTPSAGTAAHHPPGYYFLASLALRLMPQASLDAQNYAVRGVSILLGVLALCFGYFGLRELFPNDRVFPLCVIAGLAVFPQWLLVSSVIFPEVFGAVGVSGAFWALARYFRRVTSDALLPTRCFRRDASDAMLMLLAGVFTGFMALTKITLVPFAVGMALTCVILAFRQQIPRREQVKHILFYLGAALLTAGWWYVRNVYLYGRLFPSSEEILGTARHQQFIFKDGSTDMLAMLFVPEGRFLYGLALGGIFHYFWAPDDWLPPGVRPIMYQVAALTWVLTAVGLVWGVRRNHEPVKQVWQVFGLPCLIGLALFVFAYLRWTVTTAIYAKGEFGKWVMPMMTFFALAFSLGVRSLAGRWACYGIILFAAFFLAFDLLAMHRIATVLNPAVLPKVLHP